MARSARASATAQNVKIVPRMAGSVRAGKSNAMAEGGQMPTATSQKWKSAWPKARAWRRPTRRCGIADAPRQPGTHRPGTKDQASHERRLRAKAEIGCGMGALSLQGFKRCPCVPLRGLRFVPRSRSGISDRQIHRRLVSSVRSAQSLRSPKQRMQIAPPVRTKPTLHSCLNGPRASILIAGRRLVPAIASLPLFVAVLE